MKQLIFILIMNLAVTSFAGTLSLGPWLQKQTPQGSVGIEVMDAKTGHILYQYHAQHRFMPASNTKLFTAVAAVKALGPRYRFQTDLSIQPDTLSQHSIKGNLYIRFTGDPTLTAYDLKQLFVQLRHKGVQRIDGNIVMDHQHYANSTYPIGVMRSDTHFCYGAAATAIILNGNCMLIGLQRHGQGYTARILPEHWQKGHWETRQDLSVSSHVLAANAKQLKTCTFKAKALPNNHWVLGGCLPARKNWHLGMSIAHPAVLAKVLILQALKQEKIQLVGRVLSASQPAGTIPIAEHHSATLALILHHMLTYSINIDAESITKTLGCHRYGIGTPKAGASAIKAIVAPLLAPLSPPDIEDGAGMSYYNNVTPAQLTRLLWQVKRQPALASVIIPGLPIGGQTGTLMDRMKSPLLGKHVRAKTGSAQGVSTLSGYLQLTHRVLVFSIMMNHFKVSEPHARALQDQLLLRIVHLLT